MLWSHLVWGRYWGWEAKEIGALGTALWLLGYFAAHRSKLITVRGLFVGSLVGSNIVLLAWFGPNLFLGHTYGISVRSSWLLVVALTINLAFFLVGLAPAGWLRLRRA
jgi:ABC-type transport system involved in cytochrome c biogenesis permease subunit